MGQLIQAYSEFHTFQAVHRDLKWANVLISGERLKLADFGFAVWEH